MIIKNISEIEEGFKQSFRYTPLNTGSVGGDEILKLCKTGLIDSDIAATAKYLYRFKCATLEYICRDLKIEDVEEFKRKLMLLVRKRVFNAFILADQNEEFTEENSLVFFTLDYGAIWLLRPLEEDENIENWKATDVFMTGLKVKKCLMLLDFYRKVKDTCEYFNTYKMFLTYGARLRSKAVFKVDDKEFLVEFVCQNDLYEGAETEIVEKIMHYEQLLNTDGWSYSGFENQPTLLIVGDTKDSLSRLQKRVSDLKVENVQFTLI